MTIHGRLCRLLVIGCLVIGTTAPDLGAADGAIDRIGETQVKAAFLYNVLKFVQWPASDLPSDTMVIGLVSRDSFRRALDSIVNGKTVNGRPIVVRSLRDEGDARGCHVVFIEDSSEGTHKDGILRIAREGGALTVGETTRFLRDGGLVRLYVEGDRLRFQIDPVGVQLAGLKVSAQLMSLAK
jgi:uncharacterized protein DUF4154